MSLKPLLVLAATVFLTAEVKPGGQAVPETEHARLIQCIEGNTGETEQRVMQVMGSSPADFQSFTWILKQTGAESDPPYLAVHVRAVSYLPEMPELWSEENLLFLDKGADDSVEGVNHNYYLTQMSPAWLKAYEAARGNTLKACEATASTLNNNSICPGNWGTSREEQTALYQEIAPRIMGFVGETGEFYCSGARIEGDRVLTAAHCVEDGEIPKVVWPVEGAGETQVYLASARTLKKDDDLDLALLQLPNSEAAPFFKVAPLKERAGLRSVQTMGHPAGRAWTLMTLPEPISTNVKREPLEKDAYIPSKPLCWDQGLSGAPLLDGDREVVGVVKSQIVDPVVHMAGTAPHQSVINFLATETPRLTAEGATQVCNLERLPGGSILTTDGRIQIAYVDMTSCK